MKHDSMEQITLLKLSLVIEEPIIIGEQFKGGTFRPCQETIPASTIEGALFHHFGVQVPAVGLFDQKSYTRKELTYSVRDRRLNISTLPITTSYLAPDDKSIRAYVYLPVNEKTRDLQTMLKGAEFRMGALRNKGFGKCRVSALETQDIAIIQGLLNVKIFETDCEAFGITLISPKRGYLFKLTPDPLDGGSGATNLPVKGVYQYALFPGSLVKAPKVFLYEEKETYYDE